MPWRITRSHLLGERNSVLNQLPIVAQTIMSSFVMFMRHPRCTSPIKRAGEGNVGSRLGAVRDPQRPSSGLKFSVADSANLQQSGPPIRLRRDTDSQVLPHFTAQISQPSTTPRLQESICGATSSLDATKRLPDPRLAIRLPAT